jgi:hypothetical protein
MNEQIVEVNEEQFDCFAEAMNVDIHSSVMQCDKWFIVAGIKFKLKEKTPVEIIENLCFTTTQALNIIQTLNKAGYEIVKREVK